MTIKPANPSGFGFEEAIKPPLKAAAEAAEVQKEYVRAREHLQATISASPDIGRVRAELHEVRERLGASKELAQLEASRANPNRERLSRQVMRRQRAINELIEGGRIEDANQLKDKLKKLIEQMNSTGGEAGHFSYPARKRPVHPPTRPNAVSPS